jgi:hypothetical protein
MGVSSVGMPGLAVCMNMCAHPDGWCVIAAVILGHNDVKRVEVTRIIGFLKTGSKIAKLICRMWNELGKPASR